MQCTQQGGVAAFKPNLARSRHGWLTKKSGCHGAVLLLCCKAGKCACPCGGWPIMFSPRIWAKCTPWWFKGCPSVNRASATANVEGRLCVARMSEAVVGDGELTGVLMDTANDENRASAFGFSTALLL
eukprot:scaffold10256_cov31-Tisochrysis_lutea.AAC.2